MKRQSFYSHDFENWEGRYRGTFFNSLAGFKSCNLIGTQNSAGQTNLAIFFSVIHVGANPPYLGLLFRPHSVPRHTLENIRENGCFTVNAVAEGMEGLAHHTSAKFQGSEFSALGIALEYKDDFPAPFVKSSSVQIACKVEEEHLIKANQTIFVVGAIQAVHLPKGYITSDGLIEHDKLNTLAVNALNSYYSTELVRRFEYAQPHQELKEKK